MAFEFYDGTNFEINFYPTKQGIQELLSNGVNSFSYYTLHDDLSDYSTNQLTNIPVIMGKSDVNGRYQTIIPDGFISGYANSIPVNQGTNVFSELQIINNGNLIDETKFGSFQNYGSSLLGYTVIDLVNDPTNQYIGLLGGFGFPTTTNVSDKWTVTPSFGGYKDSAVSGMSANTYLLIDVSSDFTLVDGNTVKLELPQSGGTGDTLVQLYGTQINQGRSLTYYDSKYYDSSQVINQLFNGHKSVLLVKGDITNNGISYSNGYNNSNKSPYSKQNKQLISFYNELSTPTATPSSGVFFVGSGLAVIWDYDIIDKFINSSTPTTRNATFRNYVVNNLFSFQALVNVGSFYNSKNITYVKGDPVRINSICVYNKNRELLGVGVFNTTLSHTYGDQFIAKFNLIM